MEINPRILIVFPILLLTLGIIDEITTFIGLNFCGLEEANPYYGLPVIIFKLSVFSALIPVFYKMHGKALIPLTSFTLVLIVIFLRTAINNISLIVS